MIHQIEIEGKINGRLAHLSYRELCIPKWSRAFSKAIRERTGETEFSHVLAITLPRGRGNASEWVRNPRFKRALPTAAFEVVTLQQMIEAIEPTLTTTPAATDIGRTLQLFRAAGLRPRPVAPQAGKVVEFISDG